MSGIQSQMKVLMVFKVLDSRSRSSGLKSDEFQRCSEVAMFFQRESGKKLRKRFAEVQGALVEWKDKATNGLAQAYGSRRVLVYILIFSESKDLQTTWASLT